tara:strand:- start:34195 stop:35169 length:975 start_codon:yes stop_codon:yes gene_type:complete
VAKYLVTGAVGFIGTQISKILLESGHTVIGIDSLNDAYDPTIKQIRNKELSTFQEFKLLNMDICNNSLIKEIPDVQFDAVIHLAARAGVRQSLESPGIYLETNILGTLNILEFCRDAKIKKMVLASTSSLYGETNSRLIDEANPTDLPLTPYSVSKKSAELLCYSYHYQYDIDISINRYFTVYGQFGRPDMSIFKFIKLIDENKTITVFGDGTQTRDFTHVDDVARGTIASLKPIGFEIFNLGSHSPVSINHVISCIESKLNKNASREYLPKNNADVSSTFANIEKAKNLLNWEPQLSFEQGLNNTIEWYQKNKEWLTDISVDN